MARNPTTGRMSGNADDTIRLPRTRSPCVPGQRRWRSAASIGGVLLLLVCVLLWRPHPTQGEPPLADEAGLLLASTGQTTLWRLRPAPSVLVVLFSSLHAQALALNRVGAFVEKSGVPHDRVLDDVSLDRAITESGAGFDDYYQGHDYRAADLRRFYAAAESGGIALHPAEAALRARLAAAGVLSEGFAGAVISIPPTSPAQGIDAAGRRVILLHELSHGEFFTDAAYAAYVARFWDGVLTPADRALFIAYLHGQGYDSAIGELMRNECQAYLVFTPGDRYFSAAMLGMPVARMAELRRAFIDGMPPGWLKASLPK